MRDRECVRVEAAVVAAALEGGQPPPAVAAHLATCIACRRFADGVALAPALVAGGPAVSRELRRRTLAAAAADRVGGPPPVALLLAAVAVAVVNIVASLVVPVGLVTAVLEPLLPGPLALLAGVAVTSSVGLALAATLLITLNHNAGRAPALEVVR